MSGPHTLPTLIAVSALMLSVGCYGSASLLQAVAGRRSIAAERHRFVTPLALVALGLDVAGFLAAAAALSDLPLFLVQGTTATSILVTAGLAALLLKEYPRPLELAAMLLILCGLIALAASAQPGGAVPPSPLLINGLIFAVPLLAMLGWMLMQRPERGASLLLAALSGAAYGAAGLSARALSGAGGLTLLNPLVYSMTMNAVIGVVLVTLAMRRLPVNTVTSVLFGTETCGPAALGLLLLGDHTWPGLQHLAAAGFALVLLGCLLLVRAGDETKPLWYRGTHRRERRLVPQLSTDWT